MVWMTAVVVDGDGDRDRGGDGGGGDDKNDGNGANWEVRQIRGMDGEGMMLTVVELERK
jgi:hypothetical protein